MYIHTMYTEGEHIKYHRLDIFIIYYLWLGSSLLTAPLTSAWFLLRCLTC